jgi:hypothetical protein
MGGGCHGRSIGVVGLEEHLLRVMMHAGSVIARLRESAEVQRTPISPSSGSCILPDSPAAGDAPARPNRLKYRSNDRNLW